MARQMLALAHWAGMGVNASSEVAYGHPDELLVIPKAVARDLGVPEDEIDEVWTISAGDVLRTLLALADVGPPEDPPAPWPTSTDQLAPGDPELWKNAPPPNPELAPARRYPLAPADPR